MSTARNLVWRKAPWIQFQHSISNSIPAFDIEFISSIRYRIQFQHSISNSIPAFDIEFNSIIRYRIQFQNSILNSFPAFDIEFNSSIRYRIHFQHSILNSFPAFDIEFNSSIRYRVIKRIETFCARLNCLSFRNRVCLAEEFLLLSIYSRARL